MITCRLFSTESSYLCIGIASRYHRLFSTESSSLHRHNCVIMACLCIFLSTAYYVRRILLYRLLSRYQYDLFCITSTTSILGNLSSALQKPKSCARGSDWSVCELLYSAVQKWFVCPVGTKLWHCGTVQRCTALYRTKQFTDWHALYSDI
jgi:hypothetical protein